VSEVRERAAARSGAVHPALEVDLELPAPSFGAVARLVVAGMASRIGMRIDRIDELQLALDTILRRPAADDALSIRMRPEPDGLSVRVGPLHVHDGEVHDLERVLSALVDGVSTHETDGDVWLDLRVSADPLAPASS
jgi:hypothetical protein